MAKKSYYSTMSNIEIKKMLRKESITIEASWLANDRVDGISAEVAKKILQSHKEIKAEKEEFDAADAFITTDLKGGLRAKDAIFHLRLNAPISLIRRYISSIGNIVGDACQDSLQDSLQYIDISFRVNSRFAGNCTAYEVSAIISNAIINFGLERPETLRLSITSPSH